MIDRNFVRIEQGQIHYRCVAAQHADTALPLIMAHGGPGSSTGLAPLMAELCASRRIVAPDMMGNGESDPPPQTPTDIAFYADCILAVMDKLEIARADFYGHHTGAQVACELAIAHPARVGRVVLDGVGLFASDTLEEFRRRYAPPLVPAADGSHLARIWEFVAHTTRYFPHYKADAAHEIANGLELPPAAVTSRAAEVLKVWSTYHLAYDAAFRHDLRGRLPLLRVPAMVLGVAGDPLEVYAAPAAALIPGASLVAATRQTRALAIDAFLQG